MKRTLRTRALTGLVLGMAVSEFMTEAIHNSGIFGIIYGVLTIMAIIAAVVNITVKGNKKE